MIDATIATPPSTNGYSTTRVAHAPARRLGHARVGAHRDVHAHEPGRPGQDPADQEAACHGDVLDEDECHEHDRAHEGDGRVLAVEVRASPLLDRLGDALHA